jgi:hypothetical protein
MKRRERRPRQAHRQHRKADKVDMDQVLVPEALGPADAPRAAPEDAASFSAARRCASFAPRRLTLSLTAMCVSCKGLWPSAARLYLAG